MNLTAAKSFSARQDEPNAVHDPVKHGFVSSPFDLKPSQSLHLTSLGALPFQIFMLCTVLKFPLLSDAGWPVSTLPCKVFSLLILQ